MGTLIRHSDDRHFFTDVCDGYEHLDITDLEAIREYVRQNDIEVIVNCAAWTNVDGAEAPGKYELVENLNATKPEPKVVFDWTGTPTFALDLAKAITEILDDYKRHAEAERHCGPDPQPRHSGLAPKSPYANSGIYHFSGEGVCS